MNHPTLTPHAGAGDHEVTVHRNPDAALSLSAGYALSPEQATFFKAETRIDNDDELKAHILDVQESAYKVFPYPCIQSCTFLQLGISAHPEYRSIIELGHARPDGILLDIGSCFGVDARKAVADGFPLGNVVTTDLRKEFSDLGHALFNTTPETYPISFVAGDAFDPAILHIVPPFEEPPLAERLDSSTLASLNPLAGRCSVIYASNFFHLFSEDKQRHLANALAGLLSPEPGSIICGEQAGNREEGIFRVGTTGTQFDMFLHNHESWSALWDGEVFAKGKVRVDSKLDLAVRGDELAYNRLKWSVVRL